MTSNNDSFVGPSGGGDSGLSGVGSSGSGPSSSSVAGLRCFAIFNPTISESEDSAHENLLWYSPSTTDIGTQLRTVGMCTAFTTFPEIFGAGAVQSIVASGCRYVLFEAEPGFWFIAGLAKHEPAGGDGEDESCPAVGNGSHPRPAFYDDQDDSGAEAARTIMSSGHQVYCMAEGTLTKGLADATAVATAKDAVDAKQAQRPVRKAKHLRVEGGKILREKLVRYAEDISKTLAATVSTVTSALGVRSGLEMLTVAQGHFNILSMVNRLHNAHPGTVAHSVLVVGDRVAHTTLPQMTTMSLLAFISKAQATQACGAGAHGVPPDVAYVGYPTGKDHHHYLQQPAKASSSPVLTGLSAPPAPVSAPPSAIYRAVRDTTVLARLDTGPSGVSLVKDGTNGVGPSSSAAKEVFRRLAHGFSSSDATLDATAVASAIEGKSVMVLGYRAQTHCYIEDQRYSLMVFRRGAVALYCLVDEKFCIHPELQAGVSDEIAEVLMAEDACLRAAEAEAAAIDGSARQLERTLYLYRNTANCAWRSSAHAFLKGPSGSSGGHSGSGGGGGSDRAREREVLPLVEKVAWLRHRDSAEYVSLAARVTEQGSWAFSERNGAREFSFGIPAPIGTAQRRAIGQKDIFEQADAVRRFALFGLHVL